MSKLNFNEILLSTCVSTDDCGEICTAIKDKNNGNIIVANDIDEDYESLLLSAAKMYAMLETAMNILNGDDFESEVSCEDIKKMLAEARGEA